MLATRGVLSKDTHGTVVRFAPPLTIGREQLDEAVDVLAKSLAEIEADADEEAGAALTA